MNDPNLPPPRSPDAASWERAEHVAALPSVVKRGVVYVVAFVVLTTLAVLYFGKVHVVVTGRGRIVPEGDVVLVHAIQGGVVTGVVAKVGDRLPAGAPVVRLDVSETGIGLVELQQKADALAEQLKQLSETRRLIDRILANPEATLADTRTLSVTTVGTVAQILNDLDNVRRRLEDARRAQASWPARRSSSVEEIRLTRENIAINEKNYASQARLVESGEAALAQKQSQMAAYRSLAERKLISSLELAAEEEKVRGAEGAAAEARRRFEQLAVDISNQKIKLQELEGRMGAEPAMRASAVRQAENALRQSLALLRQEGANLGIQQREVESTFRTTQARAGMARNKVALAAVTIPVAGMIAEMKVTSTGELLAPGALVVTVVPDSVPLMVEASIPNRDVGFVKPGIDARIKIDAYPFQQFGTLPARVRTIVPGLGTDRSFTVSLELLQTGIAASGRTLPLFPGLTVEAELLTARQRLITRLLSAGSTSKRGE